MFGRSAPSNFPRLASSNPGSIVNPARQFGTPMEPTTFLDHYRISNGFDGSPLEISRHGPAVTYKASDLHSGAPVALTLVPVASVDAASRDQFEEKARAATLLDHINVAR